MLCLPEINELDQENVLNSQNSASFQRPQSLITRCQESIDAFSEFCLYPPDDGRLVLSCQDPPGFNPSFLFTRMLADEFRFASELPKVISYPDLKFSEDWILLPDIPPVIITPIISVSLNELVLGHNEWFLGTSIAQIVVPVPIPNFPYDLFLSRHSIVKLTAESASQARVYGANVPQLFKEPHVVQLYDNGEIHILHAVLGVLLWNSATNDQEGSDAFFNVLPLANSFAITARGASRAVSSPNGRYLLLVYNDRVDLVINPFNMPRFTASTELQEEGLESAVKAQANFCIQALNGEARNSVEFVDGRCTCVGGPRLLKRVYPRIQTLTIAVQDKLQEDLPCIMKQCDLYEAEYSNAAAFVGNRCIVSTGVCSQHIDPAVQNLIAVQDCGINLNPCTSTANCPTGSNCRNGQCVAQCSSDATCRNANPLARCVNGQCIEQTPKSQQNTNSVSSFYIVSIVFAVILLILLILLVFFSTKK